MSAQPAPVSSPVPPQPDPSTESAAGEEDPGAALGENDAPADLPAGAPPAPPAGQEPRQERIYPGSRD